MIKIKTSYTYTNCTLVSLSAVYDFALIVIIILNNESIPIMYLYIHLYSTFINSKHSKTKVNYTCSISRYGYRLKI